MPRESARVIRFQLEAQTQTLLYNRSVGICQEWTILRSREHRRQDGSKSRELTGGLQLCRGFSSALRPHHQPWSPVEPVLVQRGGRMSQQTWSFQAPCKCLRGWTSVCYCHRLEMWNNRTDESETKWWHPLWNNIEPLVEHYRMTVDSG